MDHSTKFQNTRSRSNFELIRKSGLHWKRAGFHPGPNATWAEHRKLFCAAAANLAADPARNGQRAERRSEIKNLHQSIS